MSAALWAAAVSSVTKSRGCGGKVREKYVKVAIETDTNAGADEFSPRKFGDWLGAGLTYTSVCWRPASGVRLSLATFLSFRG